MVRRSVYEQVHGLDELFAVAFNDVDFCMRVRKAGYQNIFTPFAELYHYESKSRGADVIDEKRERFVHEVKAFQYRWKEELKQGDPYLNPNFDQNREDFRIAIQPLM
jgi:GT2 family glycosyltransferase